VPPDLAPEADAAQPVDASPDASPPDVGEPDPDGGDPADGSEPWDGAACSDPYEPNDDPEGATVVEHGRLEGLRICPDDEDYFALDLHEGEPFEVRVLFEHAAGDLDVILHNTVTGRSYRYETGDDNELLEGTAASEGRYLVQVYPFRGATNDYELLVRLGQRCPVDAVEPNDTAGAATPVQAGQHSGSLCPGDEDWYAVDVGAGHTLIADLSFVHAEGDLDLEVLRAHEGAAPESVATSRGQSDGEVLEVGPLDEAARLLVRVHGHEGSWADYRLRLRVVEPGAGQRVVASGDVTWEDIVVTADGYGARNTRPARQVPVELVRASDDLVLASGRTDEQGHYLLMALNRGTPEVYLRALTRWSGDNRASVQVTDHGRSPRVYAQASAPVAPGHGGDLALDLHVAADEGVAGAFNIVDVVTDGVHALHAHLPPPNWDALSVRWAPGVALACGSCFSGREIFLGGGEEDPDEFDDSIILHELGHFVASQISRDDSPGGAHDGTRADPRLAWSEGWATFFATWSRSDPVYLDYRITGTRRLHMDEQDHPESFGTSDGSPEGLISEHLVSALLWDLVDDGAGDDDPVAGSPLALVPVAAYLASPRRSDRGYRGTDLMDYLDGYLCHEVGAADALAAALGDREVPYEMGAHPEDCEPAEDLAPHPKGHDPVDAVLLDERSGRAVLQVTPRIDVPTLRVQVLGRPLRTVGPLAAGQTLRLEVQAPPGAPLRVGVLLDLSPGRRLHAVARRPAGPPAPILLPLLRLAAPRRLSGAQGLPLLQWEAP